MHVRVCVWTHAVRACGLFAVKLAYVAKQTGQVAYIVHRTLDRTLRILLCCDDDDAHPDMSGTAGMLMAHCVCVCVRLYMYESGVCV